MRRTPSATPAASSLRALLILTGLLSVTGCLDIDDEPSTSGSGASSAITFNTPPTVTGTPPGEVNVGGGYLFEPEIWDEDGDALTFSIVNQPHWMAFDYNSGTVAGSPRAGDEGTYENITIRVSDGTATSSLRFSVTVAGYSGGTVTLSWLPPTENSDGSALTDLAGYRIYYGVSKGSYPNRIVVDNPGLTTYVVDNLSPNTYYFVATAVNSDGVESDFSNIATKTVVAN